jgi:SAM-dependent methyltransferase
MTRDVTANAAIEPALASIVNECVEGRLSPGMALMRLVTETEDPSTLETALSDWRLPAMPSPAATERLTALSNLLRGHTDAWKTVHATAAAMSHDVQTSTPPRIEVARLAAAFDRAARISPEASVALYSFGRPERLDEATTEIVGWLVERKVLCADCDLLDIGCGIGRLERALHHRVRHIAGIDVSPEMVRIAGERCAGLSNVDIRLTSGMGLEQFPGRAFDCVIAVDTFPYLVAAGGDLAEHHVAGAARVLKPGGDLVILNFSYRGSLARDRADVRELAQLCALTVLVDGEHPFTRWDGTAFHLKRR